MKRPNFFIVGAPKCGTTALAQWLAEHPQVYFSPRKEPHFFNDDGIRATTTLTEYEELFANATAKHIAVGEGSTHYLYSNTAVPNIIEYAPHARLIVCLRNPLEMAPALHGERLKQGRENVRSFEKAWRLQSERRRGRFIPWSVREDPERLLYGEYCKLGQQMDRLLTRVPQGQVHVVILDDVRIDAWGQYRRILEFLGLEDDNRTHFPVVNAGKDIRSPAMSRLLRVVSDFKKRLGFKKSWGVAAVWRSANMTGVLRPDVRSDLKLELRAYFEEDIELLESLLKRDFSSWLK